MFSVTFIVAAIGLTAVVLPVAAAEIYFPPSYSKPSLICTSLPQSRPMAIVSDFENKWFSSFLSAAKEPSLFRSSQSRSPPPDSIRFTWLRSFHPPVIVRIEGLRSSSSRLIALQLSGAGGYEPGNIRKSIDRPLSLAEMAAMRRLVIRARLSSLPAKDCSMGLDGAERLIETADGSGYHFLSRWSPERGEVREFGLAALSLTGWRFEEIY